MIILAILLLTLLDSVSDYDSAGYTVTIPAGQTSASEMISIISDGIPGEVPDEVFRNIISSVDPGGVTISQPEAEVSIVDSDRELVVFDAQYNYVCTRT